MVQREWKDTTAQELIRYESLFNLLNEIQGLDIGEAATRVAKQWKYSANVHTWRLIVFDGVEYLVIDSSRGSAVSCIRKKNELAPWDLHFIKEQRPVIYDGSSGTPAPPEHLTGEKTGQIQVLPVFNHEQCIALLTVSSRNKDFDDLDTRFIKLMGNFFANRLHSLLLQQRALGHLKQQATRDFLTNILNRGAIQEQLNSMLKIGKRNKFPVSVILGDIDHFKEINDSLGHQAGDIILQATARRLEEAARESDIVGRYGGEEFLIVLSNCGKEEIFSVAERFRKSVSNTYFLQDSPRYSEIQVTISMGTASSDSGAEYNAEKLIRAADEALYLSKKNGRNRTTLQS